MRSSISMNETRSTQSFGEILWAATLQTLKSMLSGLSISLVFISSPIWNYPDRMKKLTKLILLVLVLLIGLWIFFWLGQRPVFTISQIQIEATNDGQLKHLNLPLVKARIINQLNGNFFSIRLDKARALFEELPWVRTASVRRVWPNGLHVLIEEHEPVGIWVSTNATEPKIVNTYGELFTANLAEAESGNQLIVFQGPNDTSKEVMELYGQLNQWFEPWQVKVVSLSLSPRYSWTAKLDNAMTFELGRDLDHQDQSQIKARLERFFKYWPDVKERLPQQIDSVDLRYSNGFAVRSKNRLENKTKEGDISQFAGVVQQTAPKKVKQIESKEVKSNKKDTKKVKLTDKPGRKLHE